jgi:DNA replication protein DnaC
VKNYIKSINADYQFFDKELFENLELYMNDKPNKYDNNKGLLFIGGVGSGKTALMNMLRGYGSKVGLIMNVLDFELEQDLNYFTIDLNLCIDDIGSENPINQNYGNKYNIVESVIQRFYQRAFQNGYYFCGTSNLTTAQLNKTYSERVVDRMKEMVNIIPINNKSFRK